MTLRKWAWLDLDVNEGPGRDIILIAIVMGLIPVSIVIWLLRRVGLRND